MIKENTSLLMRGLLIVLMGLGLSAQQISAQCALRACLGIFNG